MKYLILFASLLYLTSCTTKETSLDPSYLQKLDNWKADRITNLKRPLGYLSMIGLHWLKEGDNTIGSATGNDIVMPKGVPADLGTISKSDDKVIAKLTNRDVTLDGQPIINIKLQPDAVPGYGKLNWGSYYWYLIKRGDRYGIRVKDTLADMRIQTESLPYFEPNANMIIEAEYIPPSSKEITTFKNHVDNTYQSDVKGRLRFQKNGKAYELIGTDGGDGILFIVFGDDTNGNQTYGGGRFLYVDIPNEGQKAILDFNMAENPICALNDFGTCPYPPAQNILDFPIAAGELKTR